MICLLTNVAKTQGVPLDGTIFSGNTGQTDRATFINVLLICLVTLAGITEENSTVQRDTLNYSNICWHVHHL